MEFRGGYAASGTARARASVSERRASIVAMQGDLRKPARAERRQAVLVL
jgi:hypothetical protein